MFNNEFFIGAVYLAGLLSFFSPCIFPLIPVYIGMLSNGDKRSVIKTLLFVFGLSTSFVLLGFGAGSLGYILYSDYFRIGGAIFVIIFGLFQMEIINIPFLESTKLVNYNGNGNKGMIGAFLLGFTFSLGWTPCVGPILASILVLSGDGGSPLYGAFLMLIYVLGLSSPFIVLTFSSKYLLQKLNFIKKHLYTIKKIGGLLIVIMGVLLLLNKFGIFF